MADDPAREPMDWREEVASLIPRLRRFCLALTRSPDRADDLMQATLERALTKRHLFQPGTSLDRWMMRICRNLWIDQIRRQKYQAGSIDPEDAGAMLSIDGEHRMIERLAFGEVQKAMDGLSEDHRTLLLLVAVEGHAYTEAAEILEIPVGTVMSRLARARRALADALAPPDEEATVVSLRDDPPRRGS